MARNFELVRVVRAFFAGGDWKELTNPETGEVIGFEALGTNCQFLITGDTDGYFQKYHVPVSGTIGLAGGVAIVPEGKKDEQPNG